MKLLKLPPGPKIGAILDVLLSEVIEEPEQNTVANLSRRAKELGKLELEEIRSRAKEVIEGKRDEEDRKIKRQYKV